ncbi:NadS family protein [Rhodohalobacter sulfatireducens]|uniref:Helix-turn-helix domain-containing protein n=1 Tax=Rhodohalobacter sulfatireducens TaxID=2911366 RepID=A0ABS9KD46_9BACT|nr:NadS family protein [Rhodohalobacter sulfatireducens]MCG2588784.1 helix-turn-helix domain-containing protein [Rhodohalobacter sulfatireducens]
MNDEMFNELLESVKQAGEIRKGKRKPSRYATIEEPDVVAIREKYDMTQQEFSSLLGISVGTLRNWEQGRRKPQGPAKVLLKIAEKRPKAILESLS